MKGRSGSFPFSKIAAVFFLSGAILSRQSALGLDAQDMDAESEGGDPEIQEALERLSVTDQSSTFDCSLDWDGDGGVVNDSGDLRLCFDAARARAGSANDGTGRAVV